MFNFLRVLLVFLLSISAVHANEKKYVPGDLYFYTAPNGKNSQSFPLAARSRAEALTHIETVNRANNVPSHHSQDDYIFYSAFEASTGLASGQLRHRSQAPLSPDNPYQGHRIFPRCTTSSYKYDPVRDMCYTTSSCPEGTTYNPNTQICEKDCAIGEKITRQSYSYFGAPVSPPASVCQNQCVYDNVSNTTGVSIGIGVPGREGLLEYSINYESNGNKCDFETPPEPMPPEPDNCPAGFALGADGTTCYRLPDNPKPPDSDPLEPGGTGGDSGGTGGDTGGTGGDTGGTGGDTGGTGGTGGGTGGTGGGTGGTGGGTGGTGGDTGGTGGETGGTGGGGGSGGTGGGGGSGGTGDGDGGENQGGGGGQGVELCEGERCGFGSERGDPFGEDVPSFGESFELIYQGMVNSPIGQSVSNIQFPSGGSCPVLSTSIGVFGKTIPIEFSAHCTLWEQIAPILSAAFLALWSLLAIRIFLSA